MRNVKFRARVRGKTIDVAAIIFNGGETESPHKPRVFDSYNNIYLLEDVHLMQFTGLKDRSGTEIYEGDILKYPHGASTAVVSWIECDCAFKAIDQKHNFRFGILPKPLYPVRARVIGNIHENPELLHNE